MKKPQRTRETSPSNRRTLGFLNKGDYAAHLSKVYLRFLQNFSKLSQYDIDTYRSAAKVSFCRRVGVSDKTVTYNLVVPPLCLPSKCLTMRRAARHFSPQLN